MTGHIETTDKNLQTKIERLISTHEAENEWLDYKREWHKDLVDLLKDILSFVNTYHNKDCYLIFGIEDKTFNVVGVENDVNRKNTQQIIDTLTRKPLSNEIPNITVTTLIINGKEVDVLTVFDTKKVPLFLTESVKQKQQQGQNKVKILEAGKIFTRVGDTNTPNDKTAEDYIVEKLYKKRFHLDTTIYDRYKFLVEDVENWTYLDEEQKLLYNFDPNFHILMSDYSSDEQESCIIDGDYYPWLANSSMHPNEWKIQRYIHIHFMYGQHKIFDISPAFLFDRARGFIIHPQAGWLKKYDNKDFAYVYLLENSLEWKFMTLYITAFNNSMYSTFKDNYYSTNPVLEKIVIYKDEEEKNQIEYYVENHYTLKDLEHMYDTRIIPTDEEIEKLTKENKEYGRASLLQNNLAKAITKKLEELRELYEKIE